MRKEAVVPAKSWKDVIVSLHALMKLSEYSEAKYTNSRLGVHYFKLYTDPKTIRLSDFSEATEKLSYMMSNHGMKTFTKVNLR